MLIKILTILFVSVALSGCGILGSKDNADPPAKLVDFDPSITVSDKWKLNLNNNSKIYSKLLPVYANGRIFVATNRGEVRAVNADNGKRIWSIKTKKSLSGGIGLGEGLLLIGSRDGSLLAIAPDDGRLLWQIELSSEILSPPQFGLNRVIVRTVDGKISAHAADSGAKLWVYERDMPLLTLHGTSTPIIEQDIVIVGLDDGRLAILGVDSGQLFWEVPVAMPKGRSQLDRMVDIDADPILDADMIFVSSYKGKTMAITVTNANVIWEREISTHVGLAIDQNTLYLTDLEGYIWALDRYTGNSLWQQTRLKARKVTAPVVWDKYIVVGDLDGYLHFLDKSDGNFVARQRVAKKHFNSAPVVIEDKLIAYNSDGSLTLLEIKP